MTKVFVYGTLKRGGRNQRFMAGQRFITEARTPAGFTLYSLGYYPGMIRDPHDTHGVTGELWEVDDACLALLDELEGVDEKLYERVAISLAAPFVAERAQTYLYLCSLEGRAHLGATFPV
ncbi:gamma-glutamylcyclotransferase family protein [Oleiharenicola lentus]|uniref:gamma-glutamylcyclotransferase family protein n=1 Tax=Oleiharenicola lentus TaxID=2508720 RepID=UPI003F67B3DF